MSDINISTKAYCKVILHAAKYPYCAINGVLLAKSSTVGNKDIEFVDAIPLFHIGLNLTPMAEIALMQVAASLYPCNAYMFNNFRLTNWLQQRA